MADVGEVVEPFVEEPVDCFLGGFGAGGGEGGDYGVEEEVRGGEGEASEELEVVCFYESVYARVVFAVGPGNLARIVGASDRSDDFGEEGGGKQAGGDLGKGVLAAEEGCNADDHLDDGGEDGGGFGLDFAEESGELVEEGEAVLVDHFAGGEEDVTFGYVQDALEGVAAGFEVLEEEGGKGEHLWGCRCGRGFDESVPELEGFFKEVDGHGSRLDRESDHVDEERSVDHTLVLHRAHQLRENRKNRLLEEMLLSRLIPQRRQDLNDPIRIGSNILVEPLHNHRDDSKKRHLRLRALNLVNERKNFGEEIVNVGKEVIHLEFPLINTVLQVPGCRKPDDEIIERIIPVEEMLRNLVDGGADGCRNLDGNPLSDEDGDAATDDVVAGLRNLDFVDEGLLEEGVKVDVGVEELGGEADGGVDGVFSEDVLVCWTEVSLERVGLGGREASPEELKTLTSGWTSRSLNH